MELLDAGAKLKLLESMHVFVQMIIKKGRKESSNHVYILFTLQNALDYDSTM